ncbi:MAG: 16S rRNA (cytosine(1402)-N(4))-methyltransferase RsmH [Ignavibacteria bacterium]|nr:16S rRNA (cytosine(1402)-N(4))-methyltransferase RsmH [Ignavibacteria bacterium]
MNEENFHIPVLSNKAVEYLINENIENHILVDGTLGGGGYTKLICGQSSFSGKVIAIDKDEHAFRHAKQILNEFADRIIFVNGNFADINEIISAAGFDFISGIVLDLGLSSFQLNEEDGFSFMKDTPLDMRAFKKDELTASEILNTYSKDELTELFGNYGEIGNAGRLSDAIYKNRKVKKIATTFDLVNIVTDEYSLGNKNKIDFLAKIFQSLRIEVNCELKNLEQALADSTDLLIPGGRIVIVSYHSLEDRIIKNFFRDKKKTSEKTDDPFFDKDIDPVLRILTKKPEAPSREEIRKNSRSRSAKLRAAEKI